MLDTTPDIAIRMKDFWKSKSPSEKAEMTLQMIDDGRTLVETSILGLHPDIDTVSLKIEVFKRFYNRDFSIEEMSNIVNHFKGNK